MSYIIYIYFLISAFICGHIFNDLKYEYSIFELVRIYNSFDWKKNVMIYYGY